MKPTRSLRLLLALAALFTVALAANAMAAGFTVNNSGDAGDANPGDGNCATAGDVCTLRAAVQEANALAGPDVITVPPGTYDVATALPISSDITITGHSARDTIIAGAPASGSPDRVIDVASGGTLDLTHVELTGGTASDSNGFFGGDLRNSGTATIDHDLITKGEAGSGAGLSNNAGTMTVKASTLTANNSDIGGGDSGAIQNFGSDTASGSLTVINSTITGNQANNTGGILSWGGSAAANNTTTILNSTIANNTANSVTGGLAVGDGQGSMTVENSIVSGNHLTNATASNCNGTITSEGNNLESGTDCDFTATGDRQDGNAALGALANNSGDTDTMALGTGSQALDVANASACPATDQRDVPRPQGAGCDEGAYELVPAPPGGGGGSTPPLTVVTQTTPPSSPWRITGVGAFSFGPDGIDSVTGSSGPMIINQRGTGGSGGTSSPTTVQVGVALNNQTSMNDFRSWQQLVQRGTTSTDKLTLQAVNSSGQTTSSVTLSNALLTGLSVPAAGPSCASPCDATATIKAASAQVTGSPASTSSGGEVTGGKVTIGIKCLKTTLCTGDLLLYQPAGGAVVERPRARPRARRLVGRLHFRMRAGKSAKLHVPLNKSGRKLARKHRKFKLIAAARFTNKTGLSVETDHLITIKRH